MMTDTKTTMANQLPTVTIRTIMDFIPEAVNIALYSRCGPNNGDDWTLAMHLRSYNGVITGSKDVERANIMTQPIKLTDRVMKAWLKFPSYLVDCGDYDHCYVVYQGNEQPPESVVCVSGWGWDTTFPKFYEIKVHEVEDGDMEELQEMIEAYLKD